MVKRVVAVTIAALLAVGSLTLPMPDNTPTAEGDLREAILLVRDFSGSVERTELFADNYRRLLTSLRAAAGMETALQPVTGKECAPPAQNALLVACTRNAPACGIAGHFGERVAEYVETRGYRVLTPPRPPPESA
ncbi:MAG: hypothetical protein ACLFOY_07615 [Desulfatibacillaceae bacterium]